jgi:hypothetical protein
MKAHRWLSALRLSATDGWHWHARDQPQGMYAAYMAAQPATRRFPFGFARFEVLSGFANAIFLVFIGLSIVLESVERMYVHTPP